MAQMAVNVDEKIKQDIERLYNSLGMNVNTAVNMFFQHCIKVQGLPFQKNPNNHIPLKERLKNHTGNYKTEEWDTGQPVGREIF